MSYPVDFYEMDLLLTEEERMIRDTVREFVDEKVIPVIAKHYEEAKLPSHLIPEMAELGLLGAQFSGYGCAGLSATAYGLIMQELERGDSGIRSFISVQGALCMYPIYAFGSEEQKERWLLPMAQGKVIGCFGLTEPDYGSNPGGLITRAKKDGKHYILNGAKMWITNGSMAHLAVVWAKDDTGKVKGFLVEKGTPGFSARETKNKLSLRASDTSELIFEDCKIPEENLLPKTTGLKHALMCLNQARYSIAWGAIGAAIACYEEAVNYAKTRIQFGKPIGSFQLIQQNLAQILTEITKAQLLCLRLGRLKEEDKANHAHISMAKRNNVEWALKTARMCRDMLGASGITLEYHAMRHACNLESVYTYEGTHNMHTLILGETITGISAFE